MRKSEKEHTSQLTKNTAVKEWDIEIACIYGIVFEESKKTDSLFRPAVAGSWFPGVNMLTLEASKEKRWTRQKLQVNGEIR